MFCLSLVFHFIQLPQLTKSAYQLFSHAVTCYKLIPPGAQWSLAIVAWPQWCRSSLGLWGGVCLLFVPLSLLNRIPSNQTPAFCTTRSMSPSGSTPQTLPTPLAFNTQNAVEWRVALCWGLLYKAPPSQVKAVEEKLGRLLFWHSLYVLLIGANWHRGAPLFHCIMRPSSPRQEERVPTKGWGEIGHRLKRSAAISLQNQNGQQQNFAYGFVIISCLVYWLYLDFSFFKLSLCLRPHSWDHLVLAV